MPVSQTCPASSLRLAACIGYNFVQLSSSLIGYAPGSWTATNDSALNSTEKPSLVLSILRRGYRMCLQYRLGESFSKGDIHTKIGRGSRGGTWKRPTRDIKRCPVTCHACAGQRTHHLLSLCQGIWKAAVVPPRLLVSLPYAFTSVSALASSL